MIHIANQRWEFSGKVASTIEDLSGGLARGLLHPEGDKKDIDNAVEDLLAGTRVRSERK